MGISKTGAMGMPFRLRFRPFVIRAVAAGSAACIGCSSARIGSVAAQTKTDATQPAVRLSLKSYGLPINFFQPGYSTKCDQIIGYRFVVWLNPQEVAVGFNTSPNCRLSPNRPVSGALRIVAFDTSGAVKADRTLPYLADGNGELVAEGEAMPGPGGTLLVRLQSVNLDPAGRKESESEVLLLDSNLKDVARLKGFLEQTTFIDHAVVIQKGFTLNGPRTYTIIDGPAAKNITQRRIEWPTGARSRTFGEHAAAVMQCAQRLGPNATYQSTNMIYAGARLRCTLNVLGEDNSWQQPLKEGESAAMTGILADGRVVGQVYMKGHKGARLTIWKDDGGMETLPWLAPPYEGEVTSSTADLSRYASFAHTDAENCNPIATLLGKDCDSDQRRWFIFDRHSNLPIIDRPFPGNGKAALSPDGLRYASFETGELRIYTLPAPVSP